MATPTEFIIGIACAKAAQAFRDHPETWGKGAYELNGKRCAIGQVGAELEAMGFPMNGDRGDRTLHGQVEYAFDMAPTSAGLPRWGVVTFNDELGRKVEEVIDMLDRAAKVFQS